MTDAEYYVALINESVAFNWKHDLVGFANAFSERAARLLADQPVGTIGQFLTEVDAIREAQRKEKEKN